MKIVLLVLQRYQGFKNCNRTLWNWKNECGSLLDLPCRFCLTSYSFVVLQASALEERLHETEVELKKKQEEAQKNIQQLNDANSQLVSFPLLL